MEFQDITEKVQWIKKRRNELSNLTGGEIKEWCEIVIETGKNILKDNSLGKKEFKEFSSFKNLCENSMVITVDSKKLITYFDKFYDKIEDRTIGLKERWNKKHQKSIDFHKKRKF